MSTCRLKSTMTEALISEVLRRLLWDQNKDYKNRDFAGMV